MNRRQGLLTTLGLSAGLCQAGAWAQAAQLGAMKALGQDRYQVGRIVVDKRARSFTVPGRMHALGKPLEYLATTAGGMKAYEALLELDSGGSEFNLACILIGLERDPRHIASRRQDVQAPLIGPRVAMFVAWTAGGERHRLSAAEAILNPEAGVKPETVEWVYTGAPISEGREGFAADATGTLVGFIADPNCVIESVSTIGIGAYGSVRGSALLPPNGSAIELIVQAASPTQ